MKVRKPILAVLMSIIACTWILLVSFPDKQQVAVAADEELVNIALMSEGTLPSASSEWSQRPVGSVNNGIYDTDDYWRPLTSDTADNEVWLDLNFFREASVFKVKMDLSGKEGSGDGPQETHFPEQYEIKYLTDPDFYGTYEDDPSKWETVATRSLADYETDGIDVVTFDQIKTNRITFVFQVEEVDQSGIPAPLVKQVEVYQVPDTTSEWPVPPVDLADLQQSDFSDDDFYTKRSYDTSATLDHTAHMPYYLHHFYQVISSVPLDGPDRGYIQMPVWRDATEYETQNVRVMENILSFTYFYTTDESWNPYYNSPEVRERLEASMEFWLDLQWPDGRFPETNPDHEVPMAATAFATKYMGETLRLLHEDQAPAIDPDLLNQLIEADRKAIMAVLTMTDPDMYERGMVYTNQYGNVWAGGLAYLNLFPDDVELKTALKERMEQSEVDFQSPSGFWYERESPDWGYYIHTHRQTTRSAWDYANDTEWEDHFINTESKFYDWLSYNAVPEPDGSAFILNRSIETRQSATSFQLLDNAIAEKVPLARAFAATKNEIDEQISEQRSLMEETWPEVPSLNLSAFESFGPGAFLLKNVDSWAPTEAQRTEAFEQLPYIASERFNEVRIDTRYPLITSFANRPAYYAVFNAGMKAGGCDGCRQRLGIGLIWNENGGTFLQTQTGSNTAAWGTRGEEMTRSYESGNFIPSLEVNGASKPLRPGIESLPDGEMTYKYDLGNQGNKTVDFGEEGITVNIDHEGEFTEHFPLLTLPDDGWTEESDRVTLDRDGVEFEVKFSPGASVTIEEESTSVENYQVKVLTLTAEDALSYTLRIIDDALEPIDPPEIDSPVERPLNLALSSEGTTVSASSSNSDNPESYTNDGNHLLHWRPLTADTQDNEVWLTFDFGDETTLNRMEVDMSGMDGPDGLVPRRINLPDGYQIKYLTDPDFEGTYDDDPSKWETVLSRNKTDYEADGIDDVTFDAVTTNRITILFTVPAAEGEEVPAPRVREAGVYYMPEPVDMDVDGEKGENEWYVSDVSVSFADAEQSPEVNVEYRINGGEWAVYSEDIVLEEDGQHVVEYRSITPNGHAGPIHSTAMKIDQTPPDLSIETDPTVIFPPNNKLVPIHIDVDYEDTTSGIASVELTSITSNEPDNDSEDIIDAQLGTFDQEFRLRASRSGWNHDGRIYMITYTAMDEAGNSATAESEVVVPHNMGN